MGKRTRRGLARLAGAMAALAIAPVAVVACGGESDDSGPAAAPPHFFGVVSQTPLSDEQIDRMGEGKVGALRVHIPWSIVDPEPGVGEFNFADVDPVMLAAARNDIEPQPFLFGTPRWVATELDGYHDCDPDCAIYAPRSDAALHAWSEFVRATVKRYGPEGTLWKENPDVDPVPVRAWQIWNEQNSPTFYGPKPDIEDYADLLEASAKAIRERDPEAEIVIGGMFGTPLGGERPAYKAYDYLRRLYELGADESFDGIGVHPYGAKAEKLGEQMDLMRRETERAGDTDATTWVTEVGWSSSDEKHPINKGLEGQAEELTTAFELMLENRLDWNLQGVIWYSWRDLPTDEGQCAWCPRSGLFEADGTTPKPAWEAFSSFTGGT